MEELKLAKQLAKKAAEEVMKIYKTEFSQKEKEDKTPITEADEIANALIVKGLREAFPAHAILTEEEEDDQSRLENDYVWIIDPLDGTKEFISRNGEFTINIALTYKGEPIVGVIMIPTKQELFFAEKGKGAFFEKEGKISKIQVSKKNSIEEMSLMISRSHATEKELNLIKNNSFADVKKAGSSLKGCLIAKGEADLYYRFGRTMEWDICAMHMIIQEAGGRITDLDGNLLKYNKPQPEIKGFIISNNQIHDKLVQLAKNE